MTGDSSACCCADDLSQALGAGIVVASGAPLAECPWCGAFRVEPELADVTALDGAAALT